MTEYVTAAALASYPGLGLAETAIPEIVLDTINELVDEIVEDVLGEGATLDPVPPKIRAIALEAAARSIRYAAGASSISTAIDDWKKTVRFEGEEFRAGLYLTDDEERKIRRALRPGTARTRVGSIRLNVPGVGSAHSR